MANPFDQFATELQSALPGSSADHMGGGVGVMGGYGDSMGGPPSAHMMMNGGGYAGYGMGAPPGAPSTSQSYSYGQPPAPAMVTPQPAYGQPQQQPPAAPDSGSPPLTYGQPPSWGQPPNPYGAGPPQSGSLGGMPPMSLQQPTLTHGNAPSASDPFGSYGGSAPPTMAPPTQDYSSQDVDNPFGGPDTAESIFGTGPPPPSSASTTDPWLSSRDGPGLSASQPPPMDPSMSTYGASVPPAYGMPEVASQPPYSNPYGQPPKPDAGLYGAPPPPPANPYGVPPTDPSANHYGAPPAYGALPPSSNPYGGQPPLDPSLGALALVPAQQQPPNPYAQQIAPYGQAPYGQQPTYGGYEQYQHQQLAPPPPPMDPFSVFEQQQLKQPEPMSSALVPVTSQALTTASPSALVNASDEDFWGAFSANKPEPPAPAPAPEPAPAPAPARVEKVEEEKKGDEGLPPGGEWYDARIFTPTLGVMFFKPQELTDSLFLNTDKTIVDALGDRPVVAFIVEGSSARSAGVELGHVLLKVNGVDVKNPKEASRLIKEGPRPLPLLFYVPNTDVVIAEGEHMVKYDTRETTAPNSAKEWKPKYVVIGGIIAQPWMMNMYRSKSEYDIAVIETQARRPVSVKVKQFSLQGARIQNDWQGPQMVKYKNKLHPWKYIVVLPVARNPIKISSPNLTSLKPVHEGIRRVLLAQQRDRGGRTAGPARDSYRSSERGGDYRADDYNAGYSSQPQTAAYAQSGRY